MREEPAPKKRSSGLMTVAAVLALAVVGTGAAFAYRTFVGSPRSGEPPIIRADNSPTKVVPAPSDAGGAKNLDRMLSGGGGEKLVSREEAPIDVNSRSGGPRVVFPPLNQNATAAGASVSRRPDGSGRHSARCRTTSRAGSDARHGDRPTMAASRGLSAPPPGRRREAPLPARPAPHRRVTLPPPMPAPIHRCRSPRPIPRRHRMAATNPAQTAPATSGGYLVQVSSQKNEADAQASYRALQASSRACGPRRW
jgi:hypothetical protein